jgi:hypothetical protein
MSKYPHRLGMIICVPQIMGEAWKLGSLIVTDKSKVYILPSQNVSPWEDLLSIYGQFPPVL